MENSILDKRVKPGMVVRQKKYNEKGDVEPIDRVVKNVTDNEISVWELDGTKWSASYGYNWFRPGCFEFVRQMSDREFKKIFKN